MGREAFWGVYMILDLDAIRARYDAATEGSWKLIARADIPALVAEVERLRAALDRIQVECDCPCDNGHGRTSDNCPRCIAYAALKGTP